MLKKILKISFAVLAVIVGLYPVVYFLVERKFGLLQSKTDGLLASIYWNTGFYIHITLGGLALLIGWTQFSKKIRANKIKLHMLLGKIYVTAVLLSSAAGFYIAFYATGGWISSAGFICLALIWFSTTLRAYLYIKNKQVNLHQQMMVYSYAACFAAVTLRLWLPFLTVVLHDFNTGYRIVSFLCWVPNMILAWFIVQRLRRQALPVK